MADNTPEQRRELGHVPLALARRADTLKTARYYINLPPFQPTLPKSQISASQFFQPVYSPEIINPALTQPVESKVPVSPEVAAHAAAVGVSRQGYADADTARQVAASDNTMGIVANAEQVITDRDIDALVAEIYEMHDQNMEKVEIR